MSLPRALTIDVLPTPCQRCQHSSPVHILRFNFERQDVEPAIPLQVHSPLSHNSRRDSFSSQQYEACIGGCNPTMKELLEIK